MQYAGKSLGLINDELDMKAALGIGRFDSLPDGGQFGQFDGPVQILADRMAGTDSFDQFHNDYFSIKPVTSRKSGS